MADAREFLFANNASCGLGSDLTAAATSIALETGKGSLFPSPVSGQIFKLTLQNILTGAFEIVNVTGRAGDILTVERGSEGTTPQAFPAATTLVQHRITKETLEKLQETGAGDPGSGAGSGAGSGIPQNLQNSDYTLVLTDNGKHIYHDDANSYVWTVPENSTVALPIGASITLVNDGSIEIDLVGANGNVQFVLPGQGVFTDLVLGAEGIATLLKVKPDRWYINGVGIGIPSPGGDCDIEFIAGQVGDGTGFGNRGDPGGELLNTSSFMDSLGTNFDVFSLGVGFFGIVIDGHLARDAFLSATVEEWGETFNTSDASYFQDTSSTYWYWFTSTNEFVNSEPYCVVLQAPV